MNLAHIHGLVKRSVKANSPLILSVAAGIGTLATAYLASKATLEAAEIVRDAERDQQWPATDKRELWVGRTRLVWRTYIPTAICAGVTISCVIGANRVANRKLLASQAAFAISEQAYSNYRDKVIKEYGEKKDKAIRDEIAEERVKAHAPSQEVMLIGSGDVLCCELFTMRFFNGDIESLRRAVNKINQQCLSQDYATLTDFYYEIGLSPTTESGQLGWISSRLLELDFTSVLTENGSPALAFDYNYYKVL